MYCEKCGAEVSERFCPRCGNEVNSQYRNMQPQYNSNTKKGNTGLIVLVSIVGVIAIAAVILFLALLFVESPKNTKFNDYTPPVEKQVIEEPEKKVEKSVAVVLEEEDKPIELNYSDDSYLYPTHEGYLSVEDLYSLSEREVALLRNEIYARHGYSFKNAEYEEFFMYKTWYYPNPYLTESGKVESMFNSYERANKELIIQYEKDMGWR